MSTSTLITWGAIAGGSWLALAVAIAPRIGRALKRFDDAQDDAVPELAPGDVDFIDVIPAGAPLPCLRTVTEADYVEDLADDLRNLPGWMYDRPSQPLTDDELARFDAILRGVA